MDAEGTGGIGVVGAVRHMVAGYMTRYCPLSPDPGVSREVQRPLGPRQRMLLPPGPMQASFFFGSCRSALHDPAFTSVTLHAFSCSRQAG